MSTLLDFVVKRITNMRTRKLSIGEKQVILKLRKGIIIQCFEKDLRSRNIAVIPQDANHSAAIRIRRPGYNLQRNSKMSHKISGTATKVKESQGVEKERICS